MVVFLVVLANIAIRPMGGGIQRAWGSRAMQNSRTIALAMFQYANDNDGNYPDGKSSTEVFQKLIDGNYVSDPRIFYVPLAGKTEPTEGQRLKPENVSFDVTSGIRSNAPDGLPIVFLTGYRVSYIPGGSATSLVIGAPPYGTTPRTWSEWWHGRSVVPFDSILAVCYKSNNASARPLETQPDAKAFVPHFVPVDFDPGGKVYRQLTPDGPLAP